MRLSLFHLYRLAGCSRRGIFSDRLLPGYLLLALVCLAGPVQAAEPALPYFSTSAVPPWGYEDADGVPQGLLVILAHEISRRIEQPVTVKIRPYPRVIWELYNGYADFAVLFKTPEADEKAFSLGQAATTQIFLVGRPDQAAIESLEELDGRIVGFISGSRYGEAFDQAENFEKIGLPSMEVGLQMLMKGRLDALACADQTLYDAMTRLRTPTDSIRLLKVLSEARADLYMSADSRFRHLAEPIRKALQEYRESAEYRTLLQPHDLTAADTIPSL